MYVLGNGLTSTEKHTTLFPSDGSQIRITREPKTTVNLLSDHSVLTMTTEGGKDAFIANLEDDAFLLSLERGKETDEFSVTIQTGEHLLTRVLKNGAISFEYPSSQRRKIKAALGDGSLLEVQRTVTKEVCLLCVV